MQCRSSREQPAGRVRGISKKVVCFGFSGGTIASDAWMGMYEPVSGMQRQMRATSTEGFRCRDPREPLSTSRKISCVLLACVAGLGRVTTHCYRLSIDSANPSAPALQPSCFATHSSSASRGSNERSTYDSVRLRKMGFCFAEKRRI